MRSDTPRQQPLDEQLRALGRQLDAAAPPVAAEELADATPTAEVAHLVAVDPDATAVLPLVPVPPMVALDTPRRRRGRILGVAAAAVAILAAGGAAVAMSGDDDEVRTDQAATLQPASEPEVPAADPEGDLGGFGEVAGTFADCMEGAGFTVEGPDGAGAGFGSFEELAGLVTDPAFFDALRDCTASSGLADLDIAAELDDLDVEGTLEEHLGGSIDETVRGMLDDVLAEVEGIDMAEASAQLDAWLAQLQAQLEAAGVRDRIVDAGVQADGLLACMEARGYTADDLPDIAGGLAEGETIEQLLAELRACVEQG